MNTRIVALFFLSSFAAQAQILSIDPPFPTQNDTVTILYDATQGNAALVGASPIYAHAGVITTASASPTDWKFVQGQWGQATPSVLMSSMGNNIHKIEYHMPSFYGYPTASTTVLDMAFVFRNATGSIVGRKADGSDIYYPVYPANAGLLAAFFTPDDHVITNPGDTISIHAAANVQAQLSIYDNGMLLASDTGSIHLYHDLVVSGNGEHLVELVAYDGVSTARDTVYYFGNPSIVIQNPPSGILDGINEINDSTVLLQLHAPGKEFVYVLGNFNGFLPDSAQFMHRSVNGEKFWLTLDLQAGQNYSYQYWIDGLIKVADPYSELILDPYNDGGISSNTWPNLPAYPIGLTTGHCTLLQPGKPTYAWQNSSFQAPVQTDLRIYELLVRDFSSQRNYQMILDTLDYLERLGINAIEFMPTNEFENNESWGYNPSFHMALDKYYGTPDKFKELIDSCHSRGMAVIIDMVFNHAYGQSPLVQMYWDAGQGQPASDNPWFNSTCPHPPYCWGNDFNHLALETQNFMDRVNTYWLQEFHIDGIRFDYTKGFTNGGNSGWDVTRQNLLKRLADTLWAVNPNTYVILEHWGDNNEEKLLSDYGMMLWGNSTYNFRQGAQGYLPGSNIAYGIHKQRGWDDAHLISYTESHDEERLMYDVLTYGNSSPQGYKTYVLNTALRRSELANVFAFAIPGPKMIYMFNELGYDQSINDPCRVCNKPANWGYQQVPERRRLYDVTAAVMQLRKQVPASFDGSNFTYNLGAAVKRINLQDSSMNVNVIGNWDIVSQNGIPNFPHTGMWYEYFTADSVNVLDPFMSFELAPGEYRIYTDLKLQKPSITLSEEEQVPSARLQIYPNPAYDQVLVIAPKSGDVKVFDLQGRELLRMGVEAHIPFELDVQGLTQGMYVVRLGDFVQRLQVIR
ncbi:MAG: alpha-amylase family glycosyl hydrolase [Schleiferiaceae bacterium]|nr:alpha-amylase family glycosyl hydrolase [Schleiferiaceae bacterium]